MACDEHPRNMPGLFRTRISRARRLPEAHGRDDSGAKTDPGSRRPGRDARLLDRLRCPRRHSKQRARQQGDPGAFRKLLLSNNREACRSSAYCDARLHTDRAVIKRTSPRTQGEVRPAQPLTTRQCSAGQGAAWALREIPASLTLGNQLRHKLGNDRLRIGRIKPNPLLLRRPTK